MLNNDDYSQVSNIVSQSTVDFNHASIPRPPYKALINTVPDINEYCGEFYRVRFFPLEFGEEKDGCHGYYVMGYALHEEDSSFSQIIIGGIPSMSCWDDIFDSLYGFLVTFQYAGYSEIYNKIYGFYVKHDHISYD